MCGIIGVHTINNSEDVIYIIFEGLLGLQHRGQDGVGIATSKRIIKKKMDLLKHHMSIVNY